MPRFVFRPTRPLFQINAQFDDAPTIRGKQLRNQLSQEQITQAQQQIQQQALRLKHEQAFSQGSEQLFRQFKVDGDHSKLFIGREELKMEHRPDQFQQSVQRRSSEVDRAFAITQTTKVIEKFPKLLDHATKYIQTSDPAEKTKFMRIIHKAVALGYGSTGTFSDRASNARGRFNQIAVLLRDHYKEQTLSGGKTAIGVLTGGLDEDKVQGVDLLLRTAPQWIKDKAAELGYSGSTRSSFPEIFEKDAGFFSEQEDRRLTLNEIRTTTISPGRNKSDLDASFSKASIEYINNFAENIVASISEERLRNFDAPPRELLLSDKKHLMNWWASRTKLEKEDVKREDPELYDLILLAIAGFKGKGVEFDGILKRMSETPRQQAIKDPNVDIGSSGTPSLNSLPRKTVTPDTTRLDTTRSILDDSGIPGLQIHNQ